MSKPKNKKPAKKAPREVLGDCRPPPKPEDTPTPMLPAPTHPESAVIEIRELSEPSAPPVLTLDLAAGSLMLSVQGAKQMTAQLLGTPECAPWLVKVTKAINDLQEIVKLIKGDDDKVEGLKKLVIEQGQPWGEHGSKQMVLAGARVRVKAVNFRSEEAAIGIEHLDEKKVEAYLRGAAAEPEKVLACYMKQTVSYSLKDLPPQQLRNLQKMLDDPNEWGQGLRECTKDTKYVMMAPEMENE